MLEFHPTNSSLGGENQYDIWAKSWYFGTYRTGKQLRLRPACVDTQAVLSLHCLRWQCMVVDEGWDGKLDMWLYWIVVHGCLRNGFYSSVISAVISRDGRYNINYYCNISSDCQKQERSLCLTLPNAVIHQFSEGQDVKQGHWLLIITPPSHGTMV